MIPLRIRSWHVPLLLVLVAGCASSSKTPKPPPHSQDAATESKSAAIHALKSYRSINHIADPANAQLGMPLPDAWLDGIKLRNLPHNVTFGEVLAQSRIDRVIYPVERANQPVDTVIVSKVGGFWKPAIIGGDGVAKALVQHRKKLSIQPGAHAEKMFALTVPDLNAFFLVHTNTAGDPVLTPISDYARYHIHANENVDPKILLPQLIDAAKAHNGLPG